MPPTVLDSVMRLAARHHAAGRLREAAAIYKQALQRDPRHPIALHALGVMAFETGRFSAAEKLLLRAVDADPLASIGHDDLASVRLVTGRAAEAIAGYHRAIELSPDDPVPHAHLGLALARMGQFEAATGAYQRAAEAGLFNRRRRIPCIHLTDRMLSAGLSPEPPMPEEEHSTDWALAAQPSGASTVVAPATTLANLPEAPDGSIPSVATPSGLSAGAFLAASVDTGAFVVEVREPAASLSLPAAPTPPAFVPNADGPSPSVPWTSTPDISALPGEAPAWVEPSHEAPSAHPPTVAMEQSSVPPTVVATLTGPSGGGLEPSGLSASRIVADSDTPAELIFDSHAEQAERGPLSIAAGPIDTAALTIVPRRESMAAWAVGGGAPVDPPRAWGGDESPRWPQADPDPPRPPMRDESDWIDPPESWADPTGLLANPPAWEDRAEGLLANPEVEASLSAGTPEEPMDGRMTLAGGPFVFGPVEELATFPLIEAELGDPSRDAPWAAQASTAAADPAAPPMVEASESASAAATVLGEPDLQAESTVSPPPDPIESPISWSAPPADALSASSGSVDPAVLLDASLSVSESTPPNSTDALEGFGIATAAPPLGGGLSDVGIKPTSSTPGGLAGPGVSSAGLGVKPTSSVRVSPTSNRGKPRVLPVAGRPLAAVRSPTGSATPQVGATTADEAPSTNRSGVQRPGAQLVAPAPGTDPMLATRMLARQIRRARRAPPATALQAADLNKEGAIHLRQRRVEEAIAALQQLVELHPQSAKAHRDLGAAYLRADRFDEAQASLTRAIELRPRFADAFASIGDVFHCQGKVDEAIACYRKALQLKPSSPKTHSNLLLTLNYHRKVDNQTIFNEHLKWAEAHAAPLAANTQHTNDPWPDRPLRIGYVSPDFRRHAVNYFIGPLLTSRDRSQFHITCYSDVIRPDDVTDRTITQCDRWRDIRSMNDEQVAELIRSDGIDILVDLAGHTSTNRLCVFARKPAPVQITYLGYPNTTGMSVMDYRFTDAMADPAGKTEAFHSERLVRLPNFLCYQPPPTAPEPIEPPIKTNGFVTFGCFNLLAKVTPETLGLWAKLMTVLPNSRLVMKDRMGNFAYPARRRYVQDIFAFHRIAADRVELLGKQPDFEAHLASYSKVDIMLDPFPYNGTTTTCESLWMGVPVITLLGQRHAARVGGSLLTAAGLPELIAPTPEAYARTAVLLARDPEKLGTLRKTLRSRLQKSPMMDARRFTAAVEKAYRIVWKRWCDTHAATPTDAGNTMSLTDEPN